MIFRIQFIVVFLFVNYTFSQSFITLDKDTNEFIENVNYSLFLKGKIVYNGLTENNKVTEIDLKINYDSICFSRIDYETIGFSKQNINSAIFLNKKIIYLDEVVVNSQIKNEIVLGESNRFVNRKSNSLTKELTYGIVFENNFDENLELKKIAFFVDKIKYRTEYKINFYEFRKSPINIGHQLAEIGNLLFSTKSLFLQPNQKNKIEINLEESNIILDKVSIFITIELIANYDENNNEIQPSSENSSKLKFQLSNKANYFAKMAEMPTGKLTEKLININAMINYDFAFGFFRKPNKSDIITPAIVLYAKKIN